MGSVSLAVMTRNLSTFTAYVDESGCSGSKFGDGSSQFLGIAAVIVRDSRLSEVMGLFDKSRELLNSAKPFRKFSEENAKGRFALSQQMGKAKICTCMVAIHKPSLAGTHIRENHANEYNYLLKMLIERISWAVRDAAQMPGGQNGKCSLVLSEQRMYPYDEMFAYLKKLRLGAHNCRAEWGVISEAEPVVLKHENEKPLHLADIAASSFTAAIEPKSLGMTDDRFFRNISPTLYQKHGKRFGLKLFPDKHMKSVSEALNKLL
ncbi:DUF3800 domain-containing protein [Sphingomonas changnyeongensis]|uniref:DUF3800 domain-containing protein n=1 Tax=Sphingomonas changnyeongensis TaxID=2698679 RepID=A0A7Z2NXL4_9SPHN|nr:DUF3800 domain-containing protein [Sphingomonas changnyeongensis]QHL91627.1 DUF3800 domain-containing protein [Sphingomonas changnyeongensis]